MIYDFTTMIDRRGRDAMAVDMLPDMFHEKHDVKVRDGLDMIPMWVADMNFATVPTVPAALTERAAHPIYGYFSVRDEYYDEIIRWQKLHNQTNGLKREHIGYENSVLGGVATALRVMADKGDPVLLHAPTYIGFTTLLKKAGYRIVLSPLVRDEDDIWRMDLEDMERRIVEENIKVTIFCSPHNPTGRVWEKWEAEQAMALFEKYGVKVIADEIWSDILLFGHRHVPVQSVSAYAAENTVALYAPSKTFNLAGLIGSYHIIYNEKLKAAMDAEADATHYNGVNLMSMYALIGAYKPEGYAWVRELNEVLGDNVNYACDYIRRRFDGVRVSRPEGTYMLFIDCEAWCRAHGKTMTELLNAGFEAGVFWQSGRLFNGPWFIRLNLALPKSRLEEAFARLDRYVFNA